MPRDLLQIICPHFPSVGTTYEDHLLLCNYCNIYIIFAITVHTDGRRSSRKSKVLQVNILIPWWEVRERVSVAKGSSSFDSLPVVASSLNEKAYFKLNYAFLHAVCKLFQHICDVSVRILTATLKYLRISLVSFKIYLLSFIFSGHGSWQPALGGPIWTEGLDQITSSGPFQPQPSYDLVKY